MKNSLLLPGLLSGLLLMTTPVALSAQESVPDYPPLKRIASPQPPQNQGDTPAALSLDYYIYLHSGTYTTDDLTTQGEAWTPAYRPRSAGGDPGRTAERARALLDSLYLGEPAAGGEPELFTLESVRPAVTEPGKSSISLVSVPLKRFQPANGKLLGVQSAPLGDLGGLCLRLTYSFIARDGGMPDINTDQGLQYKHSASGGRQRDLFSVCLYRAIPADIRIGYLEAELVAPPAADQIELTSASVGQTLRLGDVPVTVLAFEPGVFHLLCPEELTDTLLDAEIVCLRNGQRLPIRHSSRLRTTWARYDLFRSRPGLSPRKFEKMMNDPGLKLPPREANQAVVLVRTGCAADRVVLYARPDDPKGETVGSRIFSFSRDEAGELSVTLLRKGRDGVLRPLEEDPAMPVPPEYKGGREAMFKILGQQTIYPQNALQAGVTGTVLIRALIDSTGRMASAEVYKGVYPSLDQEALRVVRLLEEWTPATLEGEAVDMHIVLPISFRMQ